MKRYDFVCKSMLAEFLVGLPNFGRTFRTYRYIGKLKKEKKTWDKFTIYTDAQLRKRQKQQGNESEFGWEAADAH